MGYADETSHETYLSLTEDDFDAKPLRRYVASSQDLMVWGWQDISVNHFVDFDGEFTVNTTLYWNQFARVWDKINGFSGNSPSLSDILADPNSPTNTVYYNLLTGQAGSTSSQENIILGADDRSYTAMGIQSQLDWAVDIAGQLHEFNIGIRYHQDEVTRNHTEREFLMLDGKLVDSGKTRVETTPLIYLYKQNYAQVKKYYLSGYQQPGLNDKEKLQVLEMLANLAMHEEAYRQAVKYSKEYLQMVSRVSNVEPSKTV